eukprot:SAG31_NODE_4635_length_3081_cov_2.484574_4_plen_248_part_00
MVRRLLALSLLLLLLLAAAATPAETTPTSAFTFGPERAAGSTAAVHRAHCAVVAATQQMPHSLPAIEALALAMVPQQVANSIGELLSSRLGIRTALDFSLVASDGAEAQELLEELRIARVSVGDRAKVRLLLRSQPAACGEAVPDCHAAGDAGSAARARPRSVIQPQWRVLQTDNAEEGMSLDTIAIVLSVLVGGAGYILQVRGAQFVALRQVTPDNCIARWPRQAVTARRAEQAKQEQDRENHFAE